MAWQLSQEVTRYLQEHKGGGLTGAEVAVLYAIAERASYEGRYARLVWEEGDWRLAWFAGAEETSGGLRKILRKLASHGLEIRVQRGTDKRGRPIYAHKGAQTTYRLPKLVEDVPDGTPMPSEAVPDGPAISPEAVPGGPPSGPGGPPSVPDGPPSGPDGPPSPSFTSFSSFPEGGTAERSTHAAREVAVASPDEPRAEPGPAVGPRPVEPDGRRRCWRHRDSTDDVPCGACGERRREVEQAEKMHAAAMKAWRHDVSRWDLWRQRQAVCRHGTAGGDLVNPATELRVCVMCRMGTP